MLGKDYIKLPHVKEEIKSRFNYNPETGDLTWAYRDESNKQNVYFNEHVGGKVAGTVSTHYKHGYKNKRVALEIFRKKLCLTAARICCHSLAGMRPTLWHLVACWQQRLGLIVGMRCLQQQKKGSRPKTRKRIYGLSSHRLT